MIAIDATVAVKWFVAGEPLHAQARRLLDRVDGLVAPDLLAVDAADAAAAKVARGQLTEAQATRLVSALVAGDIELVPIATLIGRAVPLAVELGRTARQCAYLAVALERQIPLVTADERFHDRVTASPYAGTTRHLRSV